MYKFFFFFLYVLLFSTAPHSTASGETECLQGHPRATMPHQAMHKCLLERWRGRFLRQRVTEVPNVSSGDTATSWDPVAGIQCICIAIIHQLPELPPPPPLPPVTMALVSQSGPSSAMSREGSRTALVVQNSTEQRDASALPELSGALAPPAGTLRLRGGPRNGPRVAWDEAVVDNEGLGRKKSKSTYLTLERCQNA